MTETLVLEIGLEEIPAGYIEPALKALADSLSQVLDKARVDHSPPRVYGTPRRLAVMMESVAKKQKPLESRLMGPPARVAFDENGVPAVPAVKFAEKAGVDVKKLTRVTTPKGEYVCAVVKEKGGPTKEILAKALPDIISGIVFPKSMRWADLPLSFARPFHTILALLGKSVIPFTLNGVKSGRAVHGHFFMQPKKISIKDPGDYLGALKDAMVVADMEKRKHMTAQGIARVAQELGGEVISDPALLDMVTNLVEHPFPVGGRFDPEYLEVPREVLITAMAGHQKYFAVADENADLMPCFVAVNNTRVKDISLSAQGHERVLRARLDDARFFFKADCEQSMDLWVEKLSGIVFQEKLGTVLDKVTRVKALAEFLAENALPVVKKDLAGHVSRAAQLAKADLVSQVVVEFPKLQGVMGRVYAQRAGEPGPVCQAIEEHYRPTHSGGELPETLEGALVSVADKMDTLCGCFLVGLIPTGTADPYALRRQAIGILQILSDQGISFSVSRIIEKSLGLQSARTNESDTIQAREKVLSFFSLRMSRMLVDQGFSKDIVAAAMALPLEDVPLLKRRVSALEGLKQLPDYQELAVGFKRAVNIVRQAREKKIPIPDGASVKPALFEKDCEGALWDAYVSINKKVDDLLLKGDVEKALQSVAGLRSPVDDFFDGVMVMADDEKIKQNRLVLLSKIEKLFARFADFSRMAG